MLFLLHMHNMYVCFNFQVQDTALIKYDDNGASLIDNQIKSKEEQLNPTLFWSASGVWLTDNLILQQLDGMFLNRNYGGFDLSSKRQFLLGKYCPPPPPKKSTALIFAQAILLICFSENL